MNENAKRLIDIYNEMDELIDEAFAIIDEETEDNINIEHIYDEMYDVKTAFKAVLGNGGRIDMKVLDRVHTFSRVVDDFVEYTKGN